MTINDLVDIFEGIKEEKVVTIPYQLLKDNQLNNIIGALGGIEETCEYFIKIADAQPAEFYASEEEYQKKLKEAS